MLVLHIKWANSWCAIPLRFKCSAELDSDAFNDLVDIYKGWIDMSFLVDVINVDSEDTDKIDDITKWAIEYAKETGKMVSRT